MSNSMSHYKHLTTKERESILVLLTQGVTIRKIAEMLNRSPSTVSRELKRNTDKEGYSPSQAAPGTIYDGLHHADAESLTIR